MPTAGSSHADWGHVQGLVVTIAIGVHNIPEGLAVATVLVAKASCASHPRTTFPPALGSGWGVSNACPLRTTGSCQERGGLLGAVDGPATGCGRAALLPLCPYLPVPTAAGGGVRCRQGPLYPDLAAATPVALGAGEQGRAMTWHLPPARGPQAA